MLMRSIIATLVIPSAVSAVHAARGGPDFNGDGFEDLAIGVPEEAIDSVDGVGAVHVIYGSNQGLTASGDELWHQASSGIMGNAELFEGFGSALAWGDFDDDGFDDLAVGVPFDNVTDGGEHDGAVNVLYGGPGGLSGSGDQLFNLETPGLKGALEGGKGGTRFGRTLAAADFDGDGFDDLAIGAPGEDVQGVQNAGAVHILHGSSSGLSAGNDQRWHQNQPNIADDAEAFDHFGRSLSTGDFDGDGFDDLAIGSEEDLPFAIAQETFGDDGAVNVLYGSSGGLSASGDQFWHQNQTGVMGDAGTFEHFSQSLASGDFDGDGFDDLAIGVPNDNIDMVDDSGSVNILYGSSQGLTASGDQLWHQGVSGVMSDIGTDEHFGFALVAGDFNGDGRDDLAIGIFGEDPDGVTDAGAVAVLYGSNGGLKASGDQLWHQNSGGIKESAQPGDQFGVALRAGDFDDDGRDDLAIGAPSDDRSGHDDAGAVHILYGRGSGLSASGNQLFDQDRPHMNNAAEPNDLFGNVM